VDQDILPEMMLPGGGILLKPLLIRRFSEDLKNKKVKFFELKFTC
jgi:hypothetical protein